jgi:hypothetical protein
MNAKNTENKKTVSTTEKNIVSDFLKIARQNGDAHKSSNATTKIFDGGCNPTTYCVLAVLAASGKKPEKDGIIYSPVMVDGLKAFLSPDNKYYTLFKKSYSVFPGKASIDNIISKIDKTVKTFAADERLNRPSMHIGYDLTRSATKKEREFFGFNI